MNKEEIELLQEARSALLKEQISDKFADDHLICECMCISAGNIRDLFKDKNIEVKSLISELKLGSGCSSCLKAFDQWKDRI